ncbi:MAG: xanthine dehydrogenase family protein subunit M, partial [Leptolyngbyaceae bacterium]|nr:xanthine dehydrogenase family protein subunit M [Leptolyngbyaceae bacterium]
GTNLVDRMKAFLDHPSHLIDISRLTLNRIERQGADLRIGAMVSNTALADHPEVRRDYPLLSRAILMGASQQIRNVATVGGNLLQRTRCPYYYDRAFACNKRQPGSGCGALTGINRMHALFGASDHCVAVHPSDMAVALAVLDAGVEVEGGQGQRYIPFSDFHRLPGDTPHQDTTLRPGELITAIRLPPIPFGSSGVYVKLRDRASYAFALVSVAVVMVVKGDRIQQVRIAMGGVAHKPWRLMAVEQFLGGQEATVETFTQAATLAFAAAQPLEHNGFKVSLGQRALRRALMVAAKGGGMA